MDELRKNHILQIHSINAQAIEGIVIDYIDDRILVLICEESLSEAKKLEELDNLFVKAHTHCGIMSMKSTVISTIDTNNCIVIENSPVIPFEQKREFVRVLSSINFIIEKDNESYNCSCVNISAGGIAFVCRDREFNIGDIVTINLLERDFQKDITTKAQIIKTNEFDTVAKYLDLDKNSEDRIVGYVFDLIAKK